MKYQITVDLVRGREKGTQEKNFNAPPKMGFVRERGKKNKKNKQIK